MFSSPALAARALVSSCPSPRCSGRGVNGRCARIPVIPSGGRLRTLATACDRSNFTVCGLFYCPVSWGFAVCGRDRGHVLYEKLVQCIMCAHGNDTAWHASRVTRSTTLSRRRRAGAALRGRLPKQRRKPSQWLRATRQEAASQPASAAEPAAARRRVRRRAGLVGRMRGGT